MLHVRWQINNREMLMEILLDSRLHPNHMEPFGH